MRLVMPHKKRIDFYSNHPRPPSEMRLSNGPLKGPFQRLVENVTFSPDLQRSHMFTHQQIWAAFEAIAKARGLSMSAFSKSAGLDGTSFNLSKRWNSKGRERWPSTETLSKILRAADMDLRAFSDLMASLPDQDADETGPPEGKAE